MASTVTLNADEFENFKFGTVTLGTYASGGIAVTGEQVGCPENLVHLHVHPSAGYVAEYVPSTGKVKVYESASHSHTALTVLESGSAADKTAFVGIKDGAGTAVTGVYVGNAGSGTDTAVPTSTAAAAALAEVGSVDLSAVNFPFIAFGY